ncbi:hypothetical protein LINGRAHAP2_LOCUS12505 [Linum grandiflorum]
MLDQN